ncbi:MAG: hypothetical protein ABI548_10810 [Polyangiaceae bacterium]
MIVGGIIFYVIAKVTGGNRVSSETEINGPAVPEMGVPGYPDFVLQPEGDVGGE